MHGDVRELAEQHALELRHWIGLGLAIEELQPCFFPRLNLATAINAFRDGVPQFRDMISSSNRSLIRYEYQRKIAVRVLQFFH